MKAGSGTFGFTYSVISIVMPATDIGGNKMITKEDIDRVATNDSGQSFDEWLGELDNYTTRQERAMNDMGDCQWSTWVKWLRSAYYVGFKEGRNDDYEV